MGCVEKNNTSKGLYKYFRPLNSKCSGAGGKGKSWCSLEDNINNKSIENDYKVITYVKGLTERINSVYKENGFREKPGNKKLIYSKYNIYNYI